MWHEARKQERKIRGMLVDYRKRAERRRDFYEKIKADPTQFLQIHGRQCKIHLDPNIAAAAEGPATMMPWQGQADTMIDRFDVRAHLDYIPNVQPVDANEATYEERQMNYERYRIIAQNAFLGINEEKFLKQLHLEEQFGYTESEQKKKKPTGGVAIGFNYEDGTGTSYTTAPTEEEASDDNSDSDLDVDLSINISKIDQTQAHEMNRHGRSFGMSSNDFYSFLTNDLEEAENFKLAKEEEHEKALFSGRKSRRERRAHREKRLANRKISPPSYAAKESPTIKFDDASDSPPSPENSGKITFITSFGDDEESQMPEKPTYADKVKYGTKLKQLRREPNDAVVFLQKEHRRSGSAEKVSFKRRPQVRDRRPTASKSRNSRRSYSSSSCSRSRSRSVSRSRRRHGRRNSRSYSSSSSSNDRSRRKRRKNSSTRWRRRSRSRSSSSRSRSRSKSLSKSRSRSNSCSTSSKFQSRSRTRSSSKSSPRKSISPTILESKPINDIQPTSNIDTKPIEITHSDTIKEKESVVSGETKPLPRYYGRKRSDQSSSELTEDSSSDEAKLSPNQNTQMSNSNLKIGNSGTTSKNTPSSNARMTLAERLKRKRQAQLNKQFKADKIAEQIKTEREKQEQQTRDDELRELALKFRKKHREIRHAYDSDSSSSSSHSRSKSPLSRHRKSRSPSPKRNNRSRERDYRYRSDRDERRYRTTSRERERDRERDRSKDRDRDRYRRSPRYDDKRNDDRRYRDERRRDDRRDRDKDRDNHKTTATKSLVDY